MLSCLWIFNLLFVPLTMLVGKLRRRWNDGLGLGQLFFADHVLKGDTTGRCDPVPCDATCFLGHDPFAQCQVFSQLAICDCGALRAAFLAVAHNNRALHIDGNGKQGAGFA